MRYLTPVGQWCPLQLHRLPVIACGLLAIIPAVVICLHAEWLLVPMNCNVACLSQATWFSSRDAAGHVLDFHISLLYRPVAFSLRCVAIASSAAPRLWLLRR